MKKSDVTNGEFGNIAAAVHGNEWMIEVADASLTYRSVTLGDATPTGRQLALAAGYREPDGVTVLRVLADGQLEDIRPDEIADLTTQGRRFVIVESDRTYHFTVDSIRYDWPGRVVSGGLLRKLAAVPADKALYFERREEPDRLFGDIDLIDLDNSGVERFYSRTQTWWLNVQGVKIESDTPTIIVRDAMSKAGFDTTQGWQIFLKVVGQEKQPVELSSVIDLRTPGIEKLRLTPKEVINGEASSVMQPDFSLLDVDEEYLDDLGLSWETVIDADRRWLLIHAYLVPQGYTTTSVTLALEIPLTYPGAQIDMFYAFPSLALSSGRGIDRTQVRATIRGIEYHGWSRHRGGASPWNPASDNVITHLALVESALLKEVDQ